MAEKAKKKKSTKKLGTTYGAYGKNHSRPRRWAVDYTYLDKLSQADRVWLAEFSDRYYGGDFRGDESGEWPVEERRKAYIQKNTATTDLYTHPDVGSYLEDIADHPSLSADQERDVGPSPAYLDSQEYKAALEAFRRQLSPGRKPAAPEETPELDAARRRLEKYRGE